MNALMALLLGAMYVLGFAPFDYLLLTLLAIGGLYALLRAAPDATHAVWLAWCFGVGKYAVGASWIYVSINVYGQAPPPLALLLVALFVIGLAALFVAPLGGLYRGWRLSGDRAGWDVCAFVLAWVLLDWLSTWLLTGFPWLLPGYALLDTYAAAAASWIGVLGLGMLCVLAVTALTAALLGRRWRLLWLAGVPLGLALLAGSMSWVQPGAARQVALVQGNIDQAIKWQPEQALPNARAHLALSAPHWDADILVWPEAAVTLYPQQAEQLLQQLGERGRASATDVIVGMPGVTALPGGQYQVQNLALGLGTARGRYAKHHLVPFGEYVPLESMLRGLISFFDLPMSGMAPGPLEQPNIQLSSGPVAMAICYEIAYPDSVRTRAKAAGLLMTLSNDTWFGASIGPLQHLQIARMRAVENGRWLLRATNNGVTAIVDPQGEVVAQLPQFTAGVLRGSVRLMQGRTPFNRFGHLPLLLGMLLLGVGLLVQRLRVFKSEP